MRNYLLALALSSIFLPALAPTAHAITEDEAHSIGVNAYLYLKAFVGIEPSQALLIFAIQLSWEFGLPLEDYSCLGCSLSFWHC